MKHFPDLVRHYLIRPNRKHIRNYVIRFMYEKQLHENSLNHKNVGSQNKARRLFTIHSLPTTTAGAVEKCWTRKLVVTSIR
jgi:hypothetical protein